MALARRQPLQRRAAHLDRAGIEPVGAEQRFEQMPLPLPDEPAEAEDFAAP